MFVRASLFSLSLATVALVVAACSSSNDAPTNATCDAIVPCYLVDNAGICGAEKDSAPCATCPAGYVPEGKCTQPVDASDAAADAQPEASCGVILLCAQKNDAGVCGPEVNSAPCQPCPEGYVNLADCPAPTSDDAGDAAPE